MLNLINSSLMLSLYNGLFAICIIIYLIISFTILIFNAITKTNINISTNDNTNTNEPAKYIYGDNRKLLTIFFINLVFGIILVAKGIVYMQAQCAEKEYYKILENCIGFKK